MVEIRRERDEDIPAIDKIHRVAFGGETEPRLVEAIRASEGFIPELSLVAEVDGKVVGHILFSPITIETKGDAVTALSLAPMGVLPEYQNQGIGSELIKTGLSECQQLGHYVVIVVGYPKYYSRFGFVPAAKKGLKISLDVPDEAFMVFEGVTGALDGVSGTVTYPPFFNE
jgi:putative acetyltransferase